MTIKLNTKTWEADITKKEYGRLSAFDITTLNFLSTKRGNYKVEIQIEDTNGKNGSGKTFTIKY
jgi:hypothetical protein